MPRLLSLLLLLSFPVGLASCLPGLPIGNSGGEPQDVDFGDDDDSGGDDDDASQLFEGDEPGECDDGADNDQDGLFDCDDPDCAGAPVCDEGDDDTGDDDTGDDDDTTSADPGQPVITSLLGTWDSSEARFDFEIYVQDSSCDLGQPTVRWFLDGFEQDTILYSGPALTCSASPLSIWIGSAFTAGVSYAFGFSVEDSIGQVSEPYNLILNAS